MAGNGGQKTEVREQRAGDRGQMKEDRKNNYLLSVIGW
jgi:hypothetical protein